MQLREEVKWFAEEMEKVLRKNDHKSGWEEMTFEQLFDRTYEELEELTQVIEGFYAVVYYNAFDQGQKDLIIGEVMDVVNFLMFIARKAYNTKLSEGEPIDD